MTSVSVIIIFLNEERFIEEAIESVFAQTYAEWELLLVDDGSTDDSTRIAQQYAERYPEKVRYLEHPGHRNRGMSASRNLGVSHAEAEYVAFLDADDVWLPYKLQQQVAILSSHPEATMLYGNTQYWYSWTGDPKDVRRDFVPELVVQSNMLFEPPALLSLSYPLQDAAPPRPSDSLMRREMVERIGGFEEAFIGFYQLYEDQAFLAKVYLNEPVFVTGESEWWVRYRQHPDSCVSVVKRAGLDHYAQLFFLDWLAEYLYEQGTEDTEIWKLLREKRLIAQVHVYVQKREWVRAMQKLTVLLIGYPQVFARAWRKLRLLMYPRSWFYGFYKHKEL